jgi:predicted secreted protein
MSPTQGPNGEVNGVDVIVQVQEPAGTGSFVTVGSQRGTTIGETTNPIDISSKERREGIFLPGRYGSTMSLEHLYIPNSSGYAKLQTAMRTGTYVRLRRFELGTGLEEANAVVSGLSGSFPDQDAAVISADFTISGAWEAATP